MLLPVSFQEGRRASDTSLTQGLKAFRQQLRKSARAKGFLGLNKIKGLARQVCPASAGRTPAQSPGLQEGRGLLGEVLHQQRLLQLQHHPVAPPSGQQAPQQAPQLAPQQAPQLAPAPYALTPADGLLLSGLPLLPSRLLPAVSPVASAARLLDVHLCIGAGPSALPAACPPLLARLAPACEPLGLPQGDCEMEDLTSGPLGTCVLVQ